MMRAFRSRLHLARRRARRPLTWDSSTTHPAGAVDTHHNIRDGLRQGLLAQMAGAQGPQVSSDALALEGPDC